MSDDRVQPGVRIDGQLWEEFRRDVEERLGAVRGHLSHELETAIREYMRASEGGDTHDELTRIRSRLDEIEAAVQTENASDGRNDSVSNRTESRLQKIRQDVRSHAEETGSVQVHESVVERAIEEHAGTAYKTVRRYKRLLETRREVIPHPVADETFFARPEPFITYVENNVPREEADDLVERYGNDWWEETAPPGLLDDEEAKRGVH